MLGKYVLRNALQSAAKPRIGWSLLLNRKIQNITICKQVEVSKWVSEWVCRKPTTNSNNQATYKMQFWITLTFAVHLGELSSKSKNWKHMSRRIRIRIQIWNVAHRWPLAKCLRQKFMTFGARANTNTGTQKEDESLGDGDSSSGSRIFPYEMWCGIWKGMAVWLYV